MTWRRATGIVVAASIALWIAYDVAALLGGGVEATISRVVLGWAASFPPLALAFGVLAGHWFWPGDRAGWPLRLSAGATAAGVVLLSWGAWWALPAAFALGFVLGRLWWAQPQPRSP